jgi:phosphatidate cytidylyltransferase
MLKIRALTAAILLSLFLLALFLLPPNGWNALCAFVLGIAAWEWAGLAALATGGRSIYAATVVAALIGTITLGDLWANDLFPSVVVYYIAALFWLILVPLWMWRRFHFDGRTPLLVAGVIALVPAFAALIEFRSIHHPFLLLAVMGTVWISDSAAYFTGRRFGRRKLAPAISPGKTWEGSVGALLAVTLYALAWVHFGGIASLPAWVDRVPGGAAWMVLVLLGLAVAGMVGDLFESLIKRQAGVKDSGALLPGHGGLLDRIDALVPVLPLAVLAFVK